MPRYIRLTGQTKKNTVWIDIDRIIMLEPRISVGCEPYTAMWDSFDGRPIHVQESVSMIRELSIRGTTHGDFLEFADATRPQEQEKG
jgi:hypothetical protein